MSENNIEQEKQIDLIGLARAVWSNRKKVIRWAIIGLVVGVVVVVSIPKQYTSVVKVAPESQSKQMGGSTAALASMMGVGGGGSSEGLNEKIYPEIIESTPFLLEFAPVEVEFDGQMMPMSDYLLKHTKRAWWSYIFGFPSQAVGWIMSLGSDVPDTLNINNSYAIQYGFTGMLDAGIDTEVDEKIGVITITSIFQDPRVAKMVSDSVTVKLQRYMSDYRTAKTRTMLVSTQELLAQAKERYYIADERYAKSLDENQHLISKRAELTLERLSNERNLAFQVYSQLAQQVESLSIKMQEEMPVVTVIEPATTPVVPSAPKKLTIIIAWTFVAGFLAALIIVIKELLKK